MKDIKFRIFHDGKFHYWGFVDKDVFYGPPSLPGLSMSDILEKSEQYTGCNDKDDKEVYAGDIVMATITERENTWDDYNTNKPIEVVFRNGYFYPFGIEAQWRSSVDNVKLIGNIHQNPEMLKSTIYEWNDKMYDWVINKSGTESSSHE